MWKLGERGGGGVALWVPEGLASVCVCVHVRAKHCGILEDWHSLSHSLTGEYHYSCISTENRTAFDKTNDKV